MTQLIERVDMSYEDHIDHDQVPSSPPEQLRQSANKYLQNAIQSGEVSHSRIFLSEKLGRFVGYTTVLTDSGISIHKVSNGAYIIEADYEEFDEDIVLYDVNVQVELLRDDAQISVLEDRRRRFGREASSHCGVTILGQPEREAVIEQLSKDIWDYID